MEGVPEILYKYRDWDKEQHKSVIIHGEFYLANPKSFEDEYDCNIPLDFDSLTDKQIRKRYYELSKIQNPEFSRSQHRKIAKLWTKKKLLRDKKRCKNIESNFFDKLDKQVGVLSLSANNKNMKLWERYAAAHTGFCIGFESKIVLANIDVFGSCGPVQYVDDFPSISPFTTDQDKKTWIQQVYTKLKKWEFEEEYRIFKMRDYDLQKADRTIRIPLESIRTVVLGSRMHMKSRDEIISILKSGNYPNVEILEALVRGDHIITHKIK